MLGLLALLPLGFVSTYTTNRGAFGQGYQGINNAIQLSASSIIGFQMDKQY
ncbi:MAG TPA: hypothetical protein VEL70_06080 [Candidatus Acidoferrum sp.]|nr:hypothetical protein [Candidatus Acidoferrum sp.]